MKKAHFDKPNGLIKIEIDTFIFGNLILILKIVQHKPTNKNSDEQYLKNLIESYFKNLDDQNNQIYDKVYDDDDDLSSQYSTLSSILGIRVFILLNTDFFIFRSINKFIYLDKRYF